VTEVNDGYDTYYAERLWLLLPAVHRAADTDSFDAPGPLRELINRIGAQVAVVRRSMDRLWADQSIETCDDWVIPYLGDLLGTNLTSNLDPRAQRLDVAKTIYYRRRKGTVQVLEELALDVTGWPARVVEGFRRLGRTRHGLDPAVGPAGFPQASTADMALLMRAEGLAGALTGGLAGGFADLRSSHGALLAHTAFDESFHTADLRAARGASGHFGIPRLLVFVWRLRSFPVLAGTPVAMAGCPGQYVFDPTGRQMPLFLPAPSVPDDFAASWSPAPEWQVPGPLTSSLETALTASTTSRPYPDAGIPPRYGLGGGWQLTSIWPEIGRFAATVPQSPPSPPGTLTVDYHYGFSSMIGAGPYDRDLLGNVPAAVGTETAVSGGASLDAALAAAGATGTVTVADSLTYQAPAAAQPVASLLVRAGPGMRPVVRPTAPGPAGTPAQWIFTGSGQAQLVLDGLTVSGYDIVLRGSFETVRITACTIDPGTAAPGSPPLATAADGALLAPCRIFIEADPAAPAGQGGLIGQLVVDHCILGPVRTRFGGSVGTVTVTDSIVQGLPATSGTVLTSADVFDPSLLARGLAAGDKGSGRPVDPLSSALLAIMPAAEVSALLAYAADPLPGQETGGFPLDGLNGLVGKDSSLYDPALFSTISLSAAVRASAAQAGAGTLDPAQFPALNLALLKESFPVALGVAALAVADATVWLTRVTVLGRIAAHRLWAADSVLADFVVADDIQNGCVRFSAYADGSIIPRQYQSAAIRADGPIFTSDSYGQPGYAQLIETADAAIVGGVAGASITSGAGNGSEMGAFCADLNPVKEQGLLSKYAEYIPLGLTPAIVHVT
jgi:hypothetical protein